jgi:hypothetical protein
MSIRHTAYEVCGYRLRGQGSVLGREGDFLSLHLNMQIDTGAHPASYPMGTGVKFAGA